MADDKELLTRAKHGDLAAFESIVTKYERRVYAVALRSSSNVHDAQDITQEVFLRVYRALSDFRGDSSFSTWLYRITTNACVDHARKSSASHTVSLSRDDDSGTLEIPDAAVAHSPESALENLALGEELQAGLAMLSEEHRKVLLLRDVAGLTYAEIAQVLSLEEGTVKSRLARARKHLREILCSRGNLSSSYPSKQAERGSTE